MNLNAGGLWLSLVVAVTALPLAATEIKIQQISIDSCMAKLGSLPVAEQIGCLEGFSFQQVGWEESIAKTVMAFDRHTDHRVAASVFDLIRRSKSSDMRLAEAISFQLRHQAALYAERDKWHVLRLRAYGFVTLSETGVPNSALPMLEDALIYMDERMHAVEFGAALRAAGTLGEAGASFVPGILNMFTERFAEEEFSLDQYGTDFPPNSATTVQIEAARALGNIASLGNKNALTVLRSIVKLGKSGSDSLDRRLITSAEKALALINARGPFEGKVAEQKTVKPGIPNKLWTSIDKHPSLRNIDNATLEDQDGRQWQLRTLLDRPTLLTFFYSRCQNDGKCSTTVARLAHLQRKLRERGVDKQVRILAASYEPEYDTAQRLKRYALDRGFEFGSHSLIVRFAPEYHRRVLTELDTAVGFNAGWVNSHGVELVLLDRNGLMARKYAVRMWNDAAVIDDLLSLLD